MSKDRSGGSDTGLLVREKLVLLSVMNVLQPVKFAVLKTALSEVMTYAKLRKALDELRREKAVALLAEKAYYVTEEGRTAIGPGALSRERDCARMLYLVEMNKEGTQ